MAKRSRSTHSLAKVSFFFLDPGCLLPLVNKIFFGVGVGVNDGVITLGGNPMNFYLKGPCI